MADDHPSRRTFELLSNEVRLRVITALGDASGSEGYATLPFSDLQRAADVDDSGKLTYHLGELRDEFVERTDEGYSLTLAGIRAYQAVIAHRSAPEVEVEPFEIVGECEFCDGALTARYRDGRAYLTCAACGSNRIRYPVDAGRIDSDDPRSVLDSLHDTLIRDYGSMFNGVCPYCGGSVDSEFVFDEEHWDEAGVTANDIPVKAVCSDCSWFVSVNLPAVLRTSEPVQAFYSERGLDLWTEYAWTEEFVWTGERVERDPIRVGGSFAYGGDELHLVVDETLTVIDRWTTGDA